MSSNTFKSLKPNFKESMTKKMQSYEKGRIPGQKEKKPRFTKLSTFLRPVTVPKPPKF